MTENGIVMKVHRTSGELLVAACDAELLGRELRIGAGKHIVSPSFYGSTPVSAEDLVQHLAQATIANLLGPRVVGHARRAGLIQSEGTGTLDGIPHAEIVRL